jgi:hypothetical protein
VIGGTVSANSSALSVPTSVASIGIGMLQYCSTGSRM